MLAQDGQVERTAYPEGTQERSTPLRES